MPIWAQVALAFIAALAPLATLVVHGRTERRRLEHEAGEKGKARDHERLLARDTRTNEILDRIESAYGDFLVALSQVRGGGSRVKSVGDAQQLLSDAAGLVLLHAEDPAIRDQVARLLREYSPSPLKSEKPLSDEQLEEIARDLERRLPDDLNTRRERWRNAPAQVSTQNERKLLK